MMNLETKLRTAATDVVRDVKNTVENCKLDGKIAAEEKSIDALTREIGTLAVHNLDQGTTLSPEIMERYEAVKDARVSIEAAKAEKRTEKAVCPKCGAKTTAGMRFCGACGASMDDQVNAD